MIQIAIMLGAPLDHVVSEVDDILFFETWLAKVLHLFKYAVVYRLKSVILYALKLL